MARRVFMRHCACDGCIRLFERRGRQIYCSDGCRKLQNYRNTQAKKAHPYHPNDKTVEPPLAKPWRDLLVRFDRAITERTPEAWAAYRELAPMPQSRSTTKLRGNAWAELLWLLEEP